MGTQLHFDKAFVEIVAFACLALGLMVQPAHAADYYISPDGKPGGTGTIDSPWDIVTGLRKTGTVKSGDTVWLRGGTYGTGGPLVYSCTLSGGPSAPVVIREQRGEHAKVNGTINVSGSYIWLWGFELTNSSPQRTVVNIDNERPRGILIAAASVGVKVINMVIHDVGRAGIAGGGNNFEIYGSLFWGNGIYDGKVGPRGDATYLNLWHRSPDAGATNVVRDNIAFRNFYSGFKVYTEWPDVYIDGYELEGNVSFDNGARANGSHEHGNFIVNSAIGGTPIKRLKVIGNYTYRTPESTNPYNSEFGCTPGSGIQCEDAAIRDNYFVAGTTNVGAFKVQNWKHVETVDNTAVANGNGALAEWVQEFKPAFVQWNNNHYYGGSGTPFTTATSQPDKLSQWAFALPVKSKGKGPAPRRLDFAKWKKEASADASGVYDSNRPTGIKTVVRKNLYEPGDRANIIIFNWDKKKSVTVDLTAAGLAQGSSFEILDAQNYFGSPVATGVFRSSSPTVMLPMNLTAVSELVGNVDHLTNKHTGPEFAVFILRKRASSPPHAPVRRKGG
ncbi:MAG TPA: hypothetical protein VN622_13955 [Clostridia bacterium]|nr:hypothetical protein [Clostridia bacterium]